MDRGIKEKVLDAIQGIKEFEVSYSEEVTYSKIFFARNEEELKEKFISGELEFNNDDIIDGNMVDGSLEVDEV